MFKTVEHINLCSRKLPLHKAAGPNDLVSEHLIHSHPTLIIHNKLLFSLIVPHGYVPDNVTSKAFKALLLRICRDELETSELQFGFSDVVFLVKTVVGYFVERGIATYLRINFIS